MKTTFLRAILLAPVALTCLTTGAVCAGDADAIDTVTVTDARRDALSDARAYAQSRPGNVVLIPAEEYAGRYAVSFRDALGFTPGVVMQPSFGEDGRLSIRGSGLAQNVHLRGVELILSGAPVNAADGFGDFQEIDLLFASHVTVLKGANAFRTGATTLGGAIEIEGVNAKTVDERLLLRAEGGSWGTSRLFARAAHDFGKVNALIAGTWQRQDGFRDHSQQRNERLYANVGVNWGSSAETTLGLYVNDIDQELAGAVSLVDALASPRIASPTSVAGDWRRDVNSQRVFATTTLRFGSSEVRFGGSYSHKTLFHPVPVLLDQESKLYTGFLSYQGEAALGSVPVAWTAGLRYRGTDLDGRVFLNFGGSPGQLIGDSRQLSSSIEVYGEARAEVLPRLEAIAGVVFARTLRDYDDLLNDAEDDRLTFSQSSPRFGLLWRTAEAVQVFANVSAFFEPPTFLDLTQSGTAGFTPIKQQDGFTYEFGARGRIAALSFETAYFRARLNNEFVAFTVVPGLPAPIFNADRTVHRGIELHARMALVENWNGVSVRPRVAYAWNDFRFVNDAVYGDNRLAGLPAHIGRAAVELAVGSVRVSPNMIFQAGDNFVDYANTLRAPGHALVGVEASYEPRVGVSLYIDARNLADHGYVANYSTLADATTAASLSVFTPGEGRSVFAGVRFGAGGKP